MQDGYAQSLERLRTGNFMNEMAVVGNICLLSSDLGDKTANIPIYVDQAESVLLLITAQTLMLATHTTS